MNDPKTPNPLNQILYGPPGTGKTYQTIEEAVKIIDFEFYEENKLEDISKQKKRSNLKERFDELKKDGQIAFVTFHQSFSYEDFIEGIKPTLSENRQISYKIKNGIFKQICKNALSNYKEIEATTNPEIKDELESKEILLRFANHIQELKDSGGKDLYLPKPNNKNELSEATIDTIKRTEDGDLESIQLGGSVTSQTLNQAMIIRDLKRYLDGEIKSYQEIKPKYISKRVYHGNARYYWGILVLIKKFLDNEKNNKTEESKTKQAIPEKEALKNFVLIIDEINRGNVSKIFGELITLLEPDKRIGGDEALTLKLLYSSSFKHDDDDDPEFGVPKNLYIIGTMNTADRSLSLLDTALRRRFRFIEIMPDYSLLEDIKIENNNINISEILKSINQRIIKEYDREHQIGHSFFLKLKEDSTITDLSEIFEYEILPLLEEYFYDDREKINSVLNKNKFYIKNGDNNWELNKDALKNADKYIKIYEK